MKTPTLRSRDTIIKLGQAAIRDPKGFNRDLGHMLPKDNDPRYFDCSTEKGCFAVQTVITLYWAKNGFQSVVLPHKFAAALMATDVDVDAVFPWPAFEIRVPNGLVVAGGEEMRSIIVAENENKTALFFTVLYEETESLFGGDRNLLLGLDATQLEIEDRRWEDGGNEHTGEFSRAMILAKRLVLNVCTAINSHKQAPQGHKSGDFTVRERKPKDGTIVTDIVTGSPLRIDCTQGIRDYVSGAARGAPKVTTLVRGHWRNQAWGPGWSLHKQMWIQPFYRGEGPLLQRPVYMGNK